MRKYESVIIVKPNLSKSKFCEISEKIDNKINELTQNVNKQDYGQKALAYEVNKNKQGHYLIYQYELDEKNNGSELLELERFYRITDEILKYITVKCEEKR